ncbi:MAG: hypothetical protein NTY31_03650 [Candidatus Falkowbacteria bacterium]|nr:hypothetical protein [Candidatus Falkowbacteria bacterium]
MTYFEAKDNFTDETILTRADTLEKIDAHWLARFLGLSAVAVFLPFFIHLPWLTGPIVNAILILVLLLCGLRSAFLVACLPSLMALSGGLLPAVLAPALPFIMASNIIFVATINWFYKRSRTDFNGYWSGVLSGAVLKFVFLFFSVNILATLFIQTPIMPLVVKMLGWSQLATAVAGGLIAWIILKFLKFFK